MLSHGIVFAHNSPVIISEQTQVSMASTLNAIWIENAVIVMISHLLYHMQIQCRLTLVPDRRFVLFVSRQLLAKN